MRNFFKKLRSDSWSKYFSKTVQRVGKNNAGFSLVELIVVIAIMAVLAAVAVIGVSIYIPKAQKAADEQLVSDVKEALMLGYYNGDITSTGAVVLSKDAVYSASTSEISGVLSTMFKNPEKELRLQSDWKGGVGQVYLDFSASGFNGNQDVLMGDIQDLTDAVGAFLEHQGDDFMNFVGGNDWTEFQQKYNLDMSNDKQIANSVALFVADKTFDSVQGKQQSFIDAWCTKNDQGNIEGALSVNNFNRVGMGTLSNMAAHYARAEALASYIDANKAANGYTLNLGYKADEVTPYTSMTEWFADKGNVEGTTPDEVIASMNTVTQQFAVAMGTSMNKILSDYLSSEQAKADATAYLSMLGAISDHTDQLIESVDSDKMYGGGAASDLLNGYLSAGEAMNAISAPEGSIAVVITVKADGFEFAVFGMNE